MKGVPVKFRAKHITTGEYIYGDLIHDRHGETRITYASDIALTGYVNEAVKPGSVAQLVGYDADGNEVYEGDKVKVGNEIVQVHWNIEFTCVDVKWKNGISDSYGTVFNHYSDKPFLVKDKVDAERRNSEKDVFM